MTLGNNTMQHYTVLSNTTVYIKNEPKRTALFCLIYHTNITLTQFTDNGLKILNNIQHKKPVNCERA